MPLPERNQGSIDTLSVTMLSHLADLFAQRQFIRFWLARLAGTIANQMLMVAVA